MVDIRPNVLPDAILPLRSGDAIIVDQGADGVRKTDPISMTDSVAPVATQAEATAGTDNTKRMTSLRTKQSIASEVGVSLASISQGLKADSAVQSVNGKSGNSVTIVKGDIGLGNVDNTSDANKPVSTATQTALNLKANDSVVVKSVNGVLPVSGNVTVSAEEKRLQDTRTTAIAESFSSNVQFVETSGYSSVGDGGGALYKRVSSEPSHSGKFQSADGSWWEMVSDIPNVRQFGAGIGGDDVSAFQNAVNFIGSNQPAKILIPQGSYLGDLSSISLGGRVITWSITRGVTFSVSSPPGGIETPSVLGGSVGGTLNKGQFHYKEYPSEPTNELAMVRIQKSSSYSGGTGVKHGLWVEDTVGSVSQRGQTDFEWAILGRLQSYSNFGENVAVYAGANKYGNGGVWGGLSEVIERTGTSNPTSGTIAHEFAINARGSDTGNMRTVIDIIGSKTDGTGTRPEITNVFRVAPGGYDSANAVFKNLMNVYGEYTNALLDFSKADVTTGKGLHLKTGVAIAYDTDGFYRSFVTGGSFQWTISGNQRMSLSGSGELNLSGSVPSLRLGGVQVLRSPIGPWATWSGGKTRESLDTATATTQQLAQRLGQLIDDLKNHGLLS